MTARAKIMIVEDEVITAEALRRKLQCMGHEVPAVVASGEDAVRVMADQHPDLVLMDIRLAGGQDGIEAAATIGRAADVPVVYLTAHRGAELLQRAWETAPYGYLVKPVRDRELEITIDLALDRHRIERRRAGDELRQRLAERSADLAAAREEMESLCYSISHDLKAPLRRIQGYTQVLLEDYAGALDDQGLLCASRAAEMARHMSEMITGILDLSRISHRDVHRQPVNLSGLAQALASEMRARYPDQNVDLRIEPGVVVESDPALVEVSLENLIANAWKFTSRTPAPRVEFGRLELAGERVLFVRDNGVGFDMRRADKLFGLFQRLHPVEDFPGSGIGLAKVKRIVSRHGGRIWFESRPDQGACFYFTLNQAGRVSEPSREDLVLP